MDATDRSWRYNEHGRNIDVDICVMCTQGSDQELQVRYYCSSVTLGVWIMTFFRKINYEDLVILTKSSIIT